MNEGKLTLDNMIAKEGEHIVSNMDGELVMLNVEKGKYYNLGDIGGVIWDYLQSPIRVEHLIHKMCDEYDVTFQQCEQDILNFLNDLLIEDIIRIHVEANV